ncbi:Coiled-coil domain-containing protein 169 [Oryzias melastigma]|uniref:Coiled-coil domain-containing protein 169 n=1 Tax=Oryzias melastigma TaxID=30732 RepID=A0A834C3A5_ORYME|nr:Coiled-coil domain-containing protein 169 [Oryzias melastigma]
MAQRTEYHKCDLTRLLAELKEENEMTSSIEQSVFDLQSTMCELQKRLQSVDGEGNEWKTRYETQLELNGQLERQIIVAREKLESMRGNPVDRLASVRSYDDMSVEMLRQRLKFLSEEKSELQRQLTACHLQIQQEGKAFHKTNDERRAYLSEIANLSAAYEAQRRQRSTQQRKPPESKQTRGRHSSRKAEADSKKGTEGEEEGGRGQHLKGGGVGDSAAQRCQETRLLKESWLHSLNH